MTTPTRSHSPARTSVGNSAVQRILNKYNFTVGKAQPTKHRAGDELTISEFQQQVQTKFNTYSPELILNLDETQLSSTLTSTYKVIKTSESRIRLDISKHNATAMMCCITASGHKLQSYQLCQGKTTRSLNKFKKYKYVTLELSGTSQSLAWFNKTHLIKYINDTIKPYTKK